MKGGLCLRLGSVCDEQYSGVKDYFWDWKDAWDGEDSVDVVDVRDDDYAIEGNDSEQKSRRGLDGTGKGIKLEMDMIL